jgi:hypothetical protein
MRRFPDVLIGCLLTVAVFALGMLFASPAAHHDELIGSTWLTKDASGFFTFALAIVGVLQALLFWRQLKLIRESLVPAKEAAESAKLNAEAVMTAEGAHLYPVLANDNLHDEVFRGIIWYPNSGNESDNVPTPSVTVRFKNYGKTPAVVESIMWGIEFYPTPSSLRTMHMPDRTVIEIIVAGQETADLKVDMLATFNRGMAKSVREYRSELLFFGEVVFRDFFDRRFRCVWECDGRPDGFRLIRHEEHRDLDKK